MVRDYKKKRTKAVFAEEDMQRAIDCVKKNEMTLRQAAEVCGVTHTALFYRLKKVGDNEAPQEHPETFSSKHTFRQVFSNEQEELLVSYVLKCSRMNYGLTYTLLQKLAFDYALRLNRNFPETWRKNNSAGLDWLRGFMTRHTNLSLRKPENTSLSRGTSFNRTNVMEFYENYSRALQKYPFTADRILNLDETGVMTVVQTPNVIAEKGVKQVGQVVSGERGTVVTMVGIVSATGTAIPPVFIFPRARFHDTFMNGAPPGSVGLVNSPSSGWMTASLFLKTLEHVANHTKCSKKDPILLLVDNHDSHCSLEAIIYAKENGISMVTFPPHCTHRLQPLDVSVMGPFKAKYKVAQNDWMLSHPGKTITIHNLTELAGKAFQNAFTIKNIISGFQKPGIYPFDRNAFSDEDFDAASVTDRPNPTISVLTEERSRSSLLPQPTGALQSTSSCASVSLQATQVSSSPTTNNVSILSDSSVISPDSVRPYPKAPPRCETSHGRKRGRSKILTETPEKEALEQQKIEKQKKIKVTKKVFGTINETSDESDAFSIHDYSDGQLSDGDVDKESDDEVDYENLLVDDYIIVKFCTKKTEVHYVGQIKEKDGSELQVQFLRKKGQKFYFPVIEDISCVEIGDVVRKLHSPSNAKGTDRTSCLISFNINHSQFNFR